MRLRQLNEGGYKQYWSRSTPLIRTMPKHKRSHSYNVGRNLHKAGLAPHTIHAGIIHDYLEHGGTLDDLIDHLDDLGLPPIIVRLVNYLSDDNKDANGNGPLQHMQKVLSSQNINQDTKNDIILIKLSDRLDNLKKRARAGKLTDKYIRKTNKLLACLSTHYTGKNKYYTRLHDKIAEFL